MKFSEKSSGQSIFIVFRPFLTSSKQLSDSKALLRCRHTSQNGKDCAPGNSHRTTHRTDTGQYQDARL